jgi:hypothetical protein
MKVVGFLTEENDKLYDFKSIKNILKVSKTKLYRDLKKIEEKSLTVTGTSSYTKKKPYSY